MKNTMQQCKELHTRLSSSQDTEKDDSSSKITNAIFVLLEMIIFRNWNKQNERNDAEIFNFSNFFKFCCIIYCTVTSYLSILLHKTQQNKIYPQKLLMRYLSCQKRSFFVIEINEMNETMWKFRIFQILLYNVLRRVWETRFRDDSDDRGMDSIRRSLRGTGTIYF